MEIDTPTTGVQKEGNPPLGINLKQPLDKASINGMLAQAIVNRMAYNRVFTHTPRNEFKTLLEGRQKYPAVTKKVKRYEVGGVPVGGVDPITGALREPYIWVDETTKYDFSKMPDLQPAFMSNGQHKIDKAITELRAMVKGFLVEMPLDWGAGEITTPKPPPTGGQTIAENKFSQTSTNST